MKYQPSAENIDIVNGEKYRRTYKKCIRLCKISGCFRPSKIGYCNRHESIGKKFVPGKYCACPEICFNLGIYAYDRYSLRFCKQHSNPDMKEYRKKFSQVCLGDNCFNAGLYKTKTSVGFYCKDCKPENSIPRLHMFCEDSECHEEALYNFSDQKGIFCRHHAWPGMCLNINIKCHIKSCSNKAHFGLKRPYSCFVHKSRKMKDLRNWT